MAETKCKECKKGLGHYHYEERMTDYWQPTQNDFVCLCGKPYDHYHHEKVPVYIEAKKKA